MTEIDLEPMEELNEMALTPSEKDRMIKIFTDMAVYENRLQGIDTENIEIMIHVMPLSNVLREDIMAQPPSRQAARIRVRNSTIFLLILQLPPFLTAPGSPPRG